MLIFNGGRGNPRLKVHFAKEYVAVPYIFLCESYIQIENSRSEILNVPCIASSFISFEHFMSVGVFDDNISWGASAITLYDLY